MEFSQFYHIYNHANGNENLFLKDENYLFFLKKYAEHIHPICKTYAYCLMPNHFHLLVRTRKAEEIKELLKRDEPLSERLISKSFSNFFSSYTQAFNKVSNRKGSLFMKNFKRKQVNADAYFTKLIHYIHYNPIHHGFVNDLDDWQWSSFHSFVSNQKSLLEREEVLNWFYGKDEYLKFHQKTADEKLSLDMEF